MSGESQLVADNVAVWNSRIGLDLKDRAKAEITGLRIGDNSIPSELYEELRSRIASGASARDLDKTLGDRLRGYGWDILQFSANVAQILQWVAPRT